MSETVDVKLQIMAYTLALMLVCHEKKLSYDQTVCFATAYSLGHYANSSDTDLTELPDEFIVSVAAYHELFVDDGFFKNTINSLLKSNFMSVLDRLSTLVAQAKK